MIFVTDSGGPKAHYERMHKHISPASSLSQRGSLLRVLLIALLALGLVGAAAGGVYAYQQHKINDLHTKVDKLNSQVLLLNKAKPQQAQQQAQQTSDSTIFTSQKGVKIRVYAPAKDATVGSPLAIIGQVPGNWSFEANFSIILLDQSSHEIAKGTAQVLGAWTTDQLVPFSAQLTYTATPSGTGTLVLHKDNPSGEAKNDDQLSIPVHFK